MNIDSIKKDKAILLNVNGRMDAVTAPEFEKACEHWISLGEKNIILDLSALDYISSAGLRSVLSVGKKLRTLDGKLLLCNLGGMVKEVFEISGFASIFPMLESREAALEEVQ